jgi:hypothetical protein
MSTLDQTDQILTNYPFSKIAQKIATENWMKERISKGTWIFTTLTFKNDTAPNVAGNSIETLRHRLSKSIYKNAYRRRGKLLDVLPVIEGDNIANRVHVHAAFKVPDQLTSTEFAELLIDRWKNGRVEYRQIIAEDINRTVGYLLKTRTKTYSENVLSAF